MTRLKLQHHYHCFVGWMQMDRLQMKRVAAPLKVGCVAIVTMLMTSPAVIAGEGHDDWTSSRQMNDNLAELHGTMGVLELQTMGEAQPADETATATAELPETGLANRYLEAGSWRWHLQANAISDLDDINMFGGYWGVSYFFADDVNLDMQIGGLYIDQDDPGDNTGAINATLLLRWHFLMDDDRAWSVFAEGGAGVMLSGEDVPWDGNDSNFTPQLGIGASFAMNKERDVWLRTGLRWHHVSHSNLAGSDKNPGIDAALIYVGLDFPF